MENCQALDEPVDNGFVKENIIGEKSGLGESMESWSVSPDAQYCETMGSKDDKLAVENVQCEPMETGVVQSDFVEAVGSDAKEKSNITEGSNKQEEILAEESNAGVSGTETVGSAAQDFQITGGSILEQNGLDATLGLGSEHVSVELMDGTTVGSLKTEESSGEGKPENDPELVASEPMETGTVEFEERNCQTVEHSSEHVKGEPTETRIDPVDVGLLDTTPIPAAENSNSADHKESAASSKSKKRKSTTPIPGIPRTLRPRVNGLCKTPETYGSAGNVTVEPGGSSANIGGEGEKRKKKRKRTDQEVDDEFSRTRKRLRYFLTRIGYEHNFIEAYCGEGWKGQSAEKIKPEKELQHAASRILQCKRRIRELFQHLDSSFAEGKFQESLFDSEGEISSDDIFCSKCGSKDLSVDNDIILCDGICDRGFHQMCLKPPLLKEEIPPGDEGWLCPGCDCKVDCIDLLNDSQGTDLSIEDAWEKVFPEAAATADGGMNDDILGLPSDDSEDDEYNPETPEVEEGIQSEGSRSEDSEDSDFTSDSDEVGVRPNDDPYMGLPSDDSEDDDYNPNAPDPEKTKEESSCSDFTSASEYFSASSDANGSSGAEDDQVISSVDGPKPPGTKSGGQIASSKKKSMNSELLSLLESGNQSDPSPVSEKRQCERLDYKKLHEEAYGNDPSDSSDDEDWAEGDPSPRKKDDGAGEEASLSRKADSKTTTGKRSTKGLQRKDSEENGITSTRRTRWKKDLDGASNTAAEMQIDSPEPDPDPVDKKSGSSSSSKWKPLGEAVKERLYVSFKENEYPTRDTKENLAKELGITIQQVSKWFENARRSLRHQVNSGSKKTNNISETKDKTPSKLVEPEKEILPNGGESSEIQKPSEAGLDGSTNDKPVEPEAKVLPDNSKLTEASTPKRSGNENEVGAGPVEPEATKILPDNSELTEASTRKRSRNENEVCAAPVESEANKILPDNRELIEASTPKRPRNENEVRATPDPQTPNSASSNDRELVIAIQAKSPITEEVKKKGRKAKTVVTPRAQIQTRSRKSAT